MGYHCPMQTDVPTGFRGRPRSLLLRSHIDLPPGEARSIARIAAEESETTGEHVSPQVVMRRFIRAALRGVARG